MDKKSLSERDICTKFITPAIKQTGVSVFGLHAYHEKPTIRAITILPPLHIYSNNYLNKGILKNKTTEFQFKLNIPQKSSFNCIWL